MKSDRRQKFLGNMFTTVGLLFILFTGISLGCNYDGYRKAGCFKRNQKLFHDLLITDLDPTHDKWGKDIDWANFQDALQSLACRCEKLARGKGYAYFAIGFYGECWAGRNEAEVHAKVLNPGSHASNQCVGGDYGICDHTSKEACAGVEDNEYVYEIVADEPVPTTSQSIGVQTTPAAGTVQYKFSSRKTTWDAAVQDCRNWGGHIATPTSQNENTELWNKIKTRKGFGHVWLGISDSASEGQWVSTQAKTAVTYKPWSSGEPNGHRRENCGMMWAHSGLWNDAPCNMNLNYVCKKRGKAPSPPPTQPAYSCHHWTPSDEAKMGSRRTVATERNYCEKNLGFKFSQGNNKLAPGCGTCWCCRPLIVEYKLSSAKTTWNVAENDCRSWGGHIATPRSQTENTELWNKIKSRSGFGHIWLGISDVASEGQWVSTQGNTAVTYKPWSNGEPNGNRRENCGMMWENTGLWNDAPCSHNWNYVCTRPVIPPVEYKFSTVKTTWNVAENDCRSWGGHIATPTSQTDNTELWNKIKTRSGFGHIWLGISDVASEGQWVSTQGNAAVTYKPWSSGEPNGNRRENCGMMWENTGLWNDAPCNMKWNYVCKKGGKAPAGLTEAPYKYVATKKTWADAEADCKAWGGHLAHVTSKEENDVHLLEMRARKGFSNAWIGLSDMASKGHWTWTGTNTRAWFTYWNRGEPNNHLGKREDCVHMMLPTGLWNDLRCTASLPYICQKAGTINYSASHTKYVYEPHGKTWSDAEKDCKERGGELASIINQQENNEIWSELRKRPGFSRVWIGLTDKVTEDRWILSSNGNVAGYTNWRDGEPNNKGGVEDCTEIHVSTGKWNDQNCSDKLPYVCQINGH